MVSLPPHPLLAEGRKKEVGPGEGGRHESSGLPCSKWRRRERWVCARHLSFVLRRPLPTRPLPASGRAWLIHLHDGHRPGTSRCPDVDLFPSPSSEARSHERRGQRHPALLRFVLVLPFDRESILHAQLVFESHPRPDVGRTYVRLLWVVDELGNLQLTALQRSTPHLRGIPIVRPLPHTREPLSASASN